jgi:hypothetical protein
VGQILHGESLALRQFFLWPVGLVAGTELFVLCAWIIAQPQPGYAAIQGIAVVASLGWWILDLMAVARVGLWQSLVSPKPATAWARTVFWVVVAPVLALLPGLLFCYGVLAPVLLPLKDVLFIRWANGNLRSRFRQVASQAPPAHRR